MSKKRLQVEGITNELAGASLFFTRAAAPPVPSSAPVEPKPAITPEKSTPKPLPKLKASVTPKASPVEVPNKPEEIAERTVEETNERTLERTKQRNNERLRTRKRIRHTFDIFEDQLFSLREIALDQEKYSGARVLLGELVQQAIDMLITKEKNSKS
jgi:outer membrane biosynthesis protein TonB